MVTAMTKSPKRSKSHLPAMQIGQGHPGSLPAAVTWWGSGSWPSTPPRIKRSSECVSPLPLGTYTRLLLPHATYASVWETYGRTTLEFKK